MNNLIITKAGLDKLTNELLELKSKKRPSAIARIKHARELGDLSENADYQDAREEQAFIEGRIKELEAMIKDAQVAHGASGDIVGLGSTVDVGLRGETMQFTIVGPSEADPSQGTISNESPIGGALLEHKAGESVGVNTPDGVVEYKIISVK